MAGEGRERPSVLCVYRCLNVTFVRRRKCPCRNVSYTMVVVDYELRKRAKRAGYLPLRQTRVYVVRVGIEANRPGRETCGDLLFAFGEKQNVNSFIEVNFFRLTIRMKKWKRKHFVRCDLIDVAGQHWRAVFK